MSRYTTAYRSLVERLDEVEILLKMARRLERDNGIENAAQVNALSRGAAVLLCSHIEGYTKEVGELTLQKIYDSNLCRSKVSNSISYFGSRDLIMEIRDTSDAAKLADKVVAFFDRDISLWEQHGPYTEPISEERFNKSFSSPSYRKISAYIGRFGYSNFKRDLGFKLKSDYLTIKNLINHIVDVRNQIAHGDASVSKTPQDLLDALPLVKRFCRTTDDLFANWCKKNLCNIRT